MDNFLGILVFLLIGALVVCLCFTGDDLCYCLIEICCPPKLAKDKEEENEEDIGDINIPLHHFSLQESEQRPQQQRRIVSEV